MTPINTKAITSTRLLDETTPLISAAIVIGNKECSYGFSLIHDHRSDPLEIVTEHISYRSRLSEKNPTCVLFTKDKVFDSFGHKSKNKYEELLEDEEHEDWYFFERFLSRFTLQGEPFLRSTNVKAIDGKEMLALDVISAIIKYLKDRVLEVKNVRFMETKIRWVLSLPSSWYDDARWFRKAVTKAGIVDGECFVVSEEEAAIWYYKFVPNERLLSGGSGHEVNKFSRGSKFIVLNCTEEAAFLTALEVHNDASLNELYKSGEISGGGNQMYNALKQVLAEVVGAPVLEKYCQLYPENFAEICKTLHVRLLETRYGEQTKVKITIPCSLVELLRENADRGNEWGSDVAEFSSHMHWRRDKLCFSKELIHSFFNVPCSAIKALVNNVQEKPKIKGTKTIIMIGAFAELPILQTIIKQALPKMNFIIPHEPGYVSLTGAVIYGHEQRIQPKYPSSRVEKFIEKFEKHQMCVIKK